GRSPSGTTARHRGRSTSTGSPSSPPCRRSREERCRSSLRLPLLAPPLLEPLALLAPVDARQRRALVAQDLPELGPHRAVPRRDVARPDQERTDAVIHDDDAGRLLDAESL